MELTQLGVGDSTVAFEPMTKGDVAYVLKVCQRTVDNWVDEEGLPEPVAIGNRVYWHPDVFYRWLHARLRVVGSPLASISRAERPPKRLAKAAGSEQLTLRKSRRITQIESE